MLRRFRKLTLFWFFFCSILLWAATYTTSFPKTENPISESGKWLTGTKAGPNLWGDVQTTPGLAFGVSQPTTFGDPTALLTGTWGPNQSASATVKINQTSTLTCCYEASVRLRMTISQGSISGYEIYCSVLPNNPYCHIARWNGPSGSYCNIESSTPTIYLVNGDVLSATVSGTNPVNITGSRNGAEILQASDRGGNCNPGGPGGPWTSGSPGIGFFDGNDNNWSSFGFSSFTASDGAPNAPTNTKVTVF